MLTYPMRNEGKNAKTIFSDEGALKTLDVVILIENGKNKCSRKEDVNITMLT